MFIDPVIETFELKVAVPLTDKLDKLVVPERDMLEGKETDPLTIKELAVTAPDDEMLPAVTVVALRVEKYPVPHLTEELPKSLALESGTTDELILPVIATVELNVAALETFKTLKLVVLDIVLTAPESVIVPVTVKDPPTVRLRPTEASLPDGIVKPWGKMTAVPSETIPIGALTGSNFVAPYIFAITQHLQCHKYHQNHKYLNLQYKWCL